MKEWLRHIEVWNTPHIARGCFFSLLFWVFGLKVFSFGMSPVLFSIEAE